MVKSISQCFVSFDGEKTVYKHCEQVKGKVTLVVEEDIQIRAVRVYLYGQALTKWDVFLDRQNRQNIGKEKYVAHFVTLFGNKGGSNAGTVTLTKGRHTYRFVFTLPSSGLPSSFEGEHGAIRYWLKILVDRPTFNFNREWYRAFTVLNDIDINAPKFQRKIQRRSEKVVSKTLGFGNAGTLSLNAECDRKGYCAGEKIALNILAKNNTTKDMGRVKAKLVQGVEFVANDENKCKETDLTVIEGHDPLTKGQEKKWENELLEIPAIPPTTVERSCHIINVSYFVKVFIEVPWGFDLSVILPITIGTIPYKHPSTRPTAASNSFEIDASTAITYTKCDKGVIKFRKTDGNFVNIGAGYIPMCAYVPNFQFKPNVGGASAVTKKPAQQGAAKSPSVNSGQAAAKPPAPTVPRGVPKAQEAGLNAPVLPAYTPNYPLEASAPPAYEEVLAMDSQYAKPETTSTTELPTSDEFLLLTRFSDKYLHEFRSFLTDKRRQLLDYEGDIFALAPQPLSKFGDFPSQTCVALFLFPTKDKASQWFNETVLANQENWATSCDAFICAMKEAQCEESRFFAVNFIKAKPGIKAADMTKLSQKLVRVSKPIRIANGGRSISVGKPKEVIKGDWSEDRSVSVMQWSSLNGYYAYIAKYKSHTDLAKEIAKTYDSKGYILFQTEDLSPYQVDTEVEENNGTENNDNISLSSVEAKDMTSHNIDDDDDAESSSGDVI